MAWVVTSAIWHVVALPTVRVVCSSSSFQLVASNHTGQALELVPAVVKDRDALYWYCCPGCNVTAPVPGKSTFALLGSRAPTTNACAVIACPPVFFTVKVAFVDWFTVGDAGSRARGVTSEIVPGVCACALFADSDRAPLRSSTTTR